MIKKEFIFSILHNKLIIIIGFIAILGTVLNLIKPKKKQSKKIFFPQKSPYIKRKYIMSKAELLFYNSLKEYFKNSKHVIFTKVRMEDIIKVPKYTKKAKSWRNRIKSRHIDFIICDAETIEIQKAIELNDSSHKREDRIKRDIFVNKAFEVAGLTLLTIKAQASYTRQDIENLFYS